MRRSLRIGGIVAVVVCGALGVANSYAVTVPYDESMQDNIVQNCVTAQVSLQQIQYNDAATRVNRGQTYELLFTRYMTPLNTRAVANNYNERAPKLIDISSRFQKAHNDFKKEYEKYDTNLTELIKLPCSKNPESFHNKLQTIRSNRTNLMDTVKRTDQLVEDYKEQVEILKAELR